MIANLETLKHMHQFGKLSVDLVMIPFEEVQNHKFIFLNLNSDMKVSRILFGVPPSNYSFVNFLMFRSD